MNKDNKNRYMVTDTDLDINIWDTKELKVVAAATFEQEYWMEVNGERVWCELEEWDSALEKHLGINSLDLNVISENEIKRILNKGDF